MSPMNNRRMTPMAEPGVLDFAPGAAAAYSLRNLSLSYTGPVVTVRRSTDSAEADFAASEVRDGTLAAWCGGGDGFVKQWWSQTGSNHASQSTAAQQPKLVSAGVVILVGGKPALDFDGSDDYLQIPKTNRILSASPNTYFSMFIAARSDSTANYTSDPASAQLSPAFVYNKQNNFGGVNDRNAFGIQVNNKKLRFTVWEIDPSSLGETVDATLVDLTTSGVKVIAAIYSNASASFFGHADGASVINSSISYRPFEKDIDNIFHIGARVADTGAAGSFHEMQMSELIIYPTDQTALRQRIEGNINRHFGVF